VLEGASGRNMAFGPARTESSGMPGDSISTIISAHNDSHFSFLGHVKLNDTINVTTLKGDFVYQVKDIRVVDSSKQQVVINQQDELILTTCYPFNALQTGGNMRYQVTAIRL
jgi:sortase A